MRWSQLSAALVLPPALVLPVAPYHHLTAGAMQASVAAHGIDVDITPGHVLNRFNPYTALGVSFDAVDPGTSAQLYSATNVAHIVSAGWKPVSYRLFTELSSQAWHWNPTGAYSNAGAQQGYWTSSPTPSGTAIIASPGVELPRRGMSTVQFDPDGYSRLVDGNTSTFWKSNPYLDTAFTGEANALHPQWIILDLTNNVPIDGLTVAWANPYAVRYQVQYWTGDDAIYSPDQGTWRTFPGGTVSGGTGSTATLRLARAPVRVRYLRILMTGSSNTCVAPGSTDVRDCRGYAVRELYAGTINSGGSLHDVLQHAPAASRQTQAFVSSADPWEGSGARRGVEQPGLDLVYKSGVTQGLPMMVPVPLLYSTPQNAANEIRYLEARHYPVSYVELGEEPDGQFITPEDYGALYLQWASAIHAVDPALKLGGPVFQGTRGDVPTWDNGTGVTSWTKRFLTYLVGHGRLGDLAFFSFEHYPFDGCQPAAAQLLQEPAQVMGVLAAWKAAGVPTAIPWFITEYGYSSDSAEAESSIDVALWSADFLGAFLSQGGAAAYLYQGLPQPLDANPSCDSWGALSMFAADDNGQWAANRAQYYAAWLITQQWAEPVNVPQALHPTSGPGLTDPGSKQPLVTSYALLRPDGRWALLVINKDPKRSHRLPITFTDHASTTTTFRGPVEACVFSSASYVWHPHGANGYAKPNQPPAHTTRSGGPAFSFTFPAYSVTVLRGAIGPPTGHRP